MACRGKLGELQPPSQGCPDTPPSINPVCFICHGVPLICNLCVTYMYFKLISIMFENCLIEYRSMLKLYVFDVIIQLQEERTGQKF